MPVCLEGGVFAVVNKLVSSFRALRRAVHFFEVGRREQSISPVESLQEPL